MGNRNPFCLKIAEQFLGKPAGYGTGFIGKGVCKKTGFLFVFYAKRFSGIFVQR
jgi:hypothetical protein